MSRQLGSWMLTATGKKFWPLDPDPADVDLRDIAHALSLLCRFNGHVPFHYSVAQHSVLCADVAAHHSYAKYPGFVLSVLLHDAHEAYLADVPRPVKPYTFIAPDQQNIDRYSVWAKRVQEAILQAVGLDPAQVARWAHEIKRIDNQVLASEGVALMRADISEWNLLEEPIRGLIIMQMEPETAERLYLKRAQELLLEYQALTQVPKEERP